MDGERQTGEQPVTVRRAEHEPLAADRELRSEARPRRGLDGRRRLARLHRRYGWRLYAIPVLLAVTVFVVVQTMRPGGANTAGRDTADGGGSGPPPTVAERGPGPAKLTGNTAALPDGGAYTKQGKGTWHAVPGTSKKVGTGGKLVTYSVAVENGIPASQYGGEGGFARLVQATLSDPRGWTGSGKVRLQRVDAKSAGKPDVKVALTTPNTVHQHCGDTIHYESSCYLPSTGTVYINLARWVRGAVAFNGDIGLYRQYAINHEFGHALGNDHVGCRKNGGLAPVMMQQTFGVSDDYVYRLNQQIPSNANAVPKDGKVCKPNAWPILGRR